MFVSVQAAEEINGPLMALLIEATGFHDKACTALFMNGAPLYGRLHRQVPSAHRYSIHACYIPSFGRSGNGTPADIDTAFDENYWKNNRVGANKKVSVVPHLYFARGPL